jgi:AcrR family transcriptional regulator
MAEPTPPVRERILEATVRTVGRTGLAGFTVEDAAREAGVGRATVYRHFTGREDLLREATAWEVGHFFTRLAEHLEDAPDLRTRLDEGLGFAHRTLADHAVYQRLLRTESEGVLARIEELSAQSIALVRAYLGGFLAEEDLAPGVDVDQAADHLSRLVLSHIINAGQWDLDDDAQRADLVDTVFLPGLLA